MCSVGEVRSPGRPPPTSHRCLFWCCCCNCSCLAAKGGSENGPTKKPRDPSPCDPLLNDTDPPPTMEEILAWGKSFDKLMRSAAGRKVFRDFLRGEFSEENIMFWLACEELKKEADPDAVEEKARFIYEDYISILSPKEVSLDSHVREIVNRNMVEPTPNTFDEAQLQIYTLMHRDSYPRFVNSALYKTLAQISATSPVDGKSKSRTDSRLSIEDSRISERSVSKSESQCKHESETEREIIDCKELKSEVNNTKKDGELINVKAEKLVEITNITTESKIDSNIKECLEKTSDIKDTKKVRSEHLDTEDTEMRKIVDSKVSEKGSSNMKGELLEKSSLKTKDNMDVDNVQLEIASSKSPKNAKLSPKT